MKTIRFLVLILVLLFSSPVLAVDVLISRLVDAPDPAVRGGDISYTIDVQNELADLAEDVELTFPIPATTEFVSVDNPSCSWEGPAPGLVTCDYGDMLGTAAVPPGPVETAVIVIRSSGSTGPTVSVEATVTTLSEEQDTDNNVLGQNTTIDDGADLTTEYGPASPNPVLASGIVEFSNVVENLGPNAAQNVRVVFDVSINMTYETGSASGSGWACSYDEGDREIECERDELDAFTDAPVISWRAKVTGAQTGILTNDAFVSSDTGDPEPNNNNDTVNVQVNEGTDLTVGIEASNTEVLSGADFSVTLRPFNLGPFDASNVTVTYTAPVGVTIGVPTGTGWSCNVLLQVVTCVRPSYEVGAEDDITVPLTAPEVTVITELDHPVSILSLTPEADLDNNDATVTVTITPDGVDLAISKSKGPDPVVMGSQISSTLELTNNGPRDAGAGTIIVTDVLGPNETYFGFEGDNWSCSETTPGSVECVYGAILPDDETVVLTLITSAVVVPGDQVLENTASVIYSGDPGDYDNSNNVSVASVTSTEAAADLVLLKSAEAGVDALGDNTDGDPARLDADPGPPELLENTIRYTLTIRNDGPDSAGGIVLTDPIPGHMSGTSVVVSSQPANYSCTPGSTVTCTQDAGTELANGATDTFVIDVTRPLRSGSRVNRASAFSTLVGDDNRDNNRAEVTIQVEAVADVEVQEKVILNPDDEVKSGVEATYMITIINNGPSSAVNVELIDTFTIAPGDPGFTFISAKDGDGNPVCTGMTPGGSYPDDGPAGLSCTMGDLGRNATTTLEVVIRPNYMETPPEPRTFNNEVSVGTTTYDSNHTNDDLGPVTLTILRDEIDLLINNTDIPDPVAWDPGADFSGDNDNNDVDYYVTYTNRGPSYATGVQYRYTMTPKDGRTVRFECDEEALGDACGTSADVCVIDSGSNPVTGPDSLVLLCNASTVVGEVDEMTASSTGERYLRFRVLSEPDATDDTHSTNAAISANEYEEILSNNEEAETTSVRARVDLEVVGKDSSEASVQLDQPFQWTITVVNNGPLESTETTLTDELPDGMSLHGAAPSWENADDGSSGGCSLTDRTLECELGFMSLDATAVVTVPVTIDGYTLATVENCVVAVTNGVDVIPGNNEDVCGSVDVENSYFPSDYGDAPDGAPGTGVGDYETTLDNGGARHLQPGGTWLGNCVDADGDGTQQDEAALADDLGAGEVQEGICQDGDDEDGVLMPPAIIVSQDFLLPVTVSGETCLLDGWIDYNADGDFDDDGEQVFVSLSLDAGAHEPLVTVPADMVFGPTYARFRCSASGGLGPVGETLGGEVEDYFVGLQPDPEDPATPVDYGDAPDAATGTANLDYETVTLDDGPSHALGVANAPFLGNCVDSDSSGQQGLAALADDTGAAGGGAELVVGSCTGMDDEDGVNLPGFLVQGRSDGEIEVTASSGTEDCVLNAWIDYNDDGDFNGPSEQIAFDLTIPSGGTLTLAPDVPADFEVVGLKYARFRCSSAGGLGPTGYAADGEVEDHLLFIRPDLALLPVDFGDAPDSSPGEASQDYTTVEANGGPSHVMVLSDSPYLGACVDSDDGTANDLDAVADDTTGAMALAVTRGTCSVPGQDEDGVTFPPQTFQGGTFDLGVTVSPAADCLLNGWVDFNQDGRFDGPGEQVLTDQLQAAGTTASWPFTVPPETPIGQTYARFRCSSRPAIGPTGPAPDGEVEDYLLNIIAGVARFRVEKDFSDDNPASVDVEIECNAGLPLSQSFTISEDGNGVQFTVREFESGAMDCTITETPVPGYVASYENHIGDPSDTDCSYTSVERGSELLCTITNTLQPVEFAVEKRWDSSGEPHYDVPLLATLYMECNNVAGGSDSWQWSVEGDQTETVMLLPHYDGSTTCRVLELDAGPAIERSGCEEPVPVAVGEAGAGCVVVNTVFFEGIPGLDRRGIVLLALLVLGIGLVAVRRIA